MAEIDVILIQLSKIEKLIGMSNPIYKEFMEYYSNIYDEVQRLKEKSNYYVPNTTTITVEDKKLTVEQLMNMGIISRGNLVVFINEDHLMGRDGYIREVGRLNLFTVPQQLSAHTGQPTKQWKLWEAVKNCKVCFVHSEANKASIEDGNPIYIHIHYGDIKEEIK